ncbi:VapA/VapB family virulence-associated protein [Xenorhabdus bovienii]|uniref:Possible virulence associated protein VapA n=2 Tax=Xenorhabdus bovienii TaxID=40576 RepID=A0A0B6X2V5_XENBV|nr:VapA/VapB family virulence-associated protein [Xenorhabdus bovienii]CDH03990.1 hypothetical protein XBFM1_900047 [Xenorhabdus bovienii str. feltiae Moldova]CDM87850.1 Possible virulence associated protein VapA [Xenorhabdus bovienii]
MKDTKLVLPDELKAEAIKAFCDSMSGKSSSKNIDKTIKMMFDKNDDYLFSASVSIISEIIHYNVTATLDDGSKKFSGGAWGASTAGYADYWSGTVTTANPTDLFAKTVHFWAYTWTFAGKLIFQDSNYYPLGGFMGKGLGTLTGLAKGDGDWNS